MYRSVKEVSAKSYISTQAYNANFFTYTVTTGPPPQFMKTGTLVVVTGATSVTCPAGNILRENGKKLFPDAYPGVTDYMVGVFDTLNNLSGFIDPNDPVFAPFNGDRPNYLTDSVNSVTKNLGAPTLTLGNVVASGQVRSNTVTQIGFFSSAAAATINVSLGQVFNITVLSGYNISMFASNILPGSHVYLIITVLAAGGGGLMTFNSPIKAKTAFDTSAAGVYTIHFICDNTNLYELGRTLALF
jgi:hypothetical protein